MIKTDALKELIPGLVTVLVAGTFLSILGPYGTSDLGMPGSWFYWVGLMAVGWLSNALAQPLTRRLADSWPPLAYYGLTSVLVSIPVTAGVAIIQALTFQPYPLAALPTVFVFVWVISAAVTFIGWMLDNRAAEAGTPSIGRALLDKLPPRLRRASLLALQSEDHYLRVHTDQGDTLILMRLSDALAAVEALDGRQTHRSWWVARKAVDAVARGDGRATLTLSNGVEAPVSRTHAPALREAGWY